MARKSDAERVKVWTERLEAADKCYKKWNDKYKCDILYKYYLGHQWREGTDENGKLKYTINMIFPTIESQLPSQLFYHPRFKIKARPSHTQTPGSTADARAQLQEETLNYFVRDKRLAFKQETFDSLLESYFSFGAIEVGYSGNFADNPNAGKPVLKENSDQPMTDSEGKAVMNPSQLLMAERVYFKRIPAEQFRVAPTSKSRQLSRCDWYAYFEWHHPEDLKRNKKYKNTSNVRTTGKLDSDTSPSTYSDADEESKVRSMAKVWKIYDLRAKVKYVLAEGNDKFLLDGEPMDLWEDGTPVLQHAILMRHPRLYDFYPLPAVYNWISPQDELNETRDMQRIHRKRFLRKYWALVSGFESQEEIAKLEQPIDGLIVRVTKENPVGPIPDAPLDPTVVRNIPQTKEDFREISGNPAEHRGIAEAETATQANIIDNESRIRDNKSRDNVADWLAEIGRIALYQLRKKMALPQWIQINVDTAAQIGMQLQAVKIQGEWANIQREDLDGVDTEVDVDVTSMAPKSEMQERDSWLAALGLITDPVRGPVLLANDILLRKTMAFFDLRDDQELQALKQFGIMALQMAMAAQMAQAGVKGGGGGGPQPNQAQPGPTPSNGEIQGQLAQQMPIQ